LSIRTKYPPGISFSAQIENRESTFAHPMRSSVSKGAPPPVVWVGLIWVYSGVCWLLGLFAASQAGWPEGVLALAVRLAAALAVGVGLCALERWAWGPAVCIAGMYAALGGVLAVSAFYTLLTLPPTALSWMPVFWGLRRGTTLDLGLAALLCAAAGAASLAVLWRAKEQFEVPYRRSFTVMLRYGLAPTLAVLSADAYLVATWWIGQRA
jgi:hypothetical protein